MILIENLMALLDVTNFGVNAPNVVVTIAQTSDPGPQRQAVDPRQKGFIVLKVGYSLLLLS